MSGAFTIGEADALLANDLIEVKGKWLETLEIILSVAISENVITLTGDTELKIDTFNIDLPFSNLPNPFGSMLSHLTDVLSCSVSAAIYVEINNASFRADLDLEIDCMGNHRLPTFSITASPSDLTSLINSINEAKRLAEKALKEAQDAAKKAAEEAAKKAKEAAELLTQQYFIILL